MAKLALINREEKRRKTVERFAVKRAGLQLVLNDSSLSDEERFEARLKFQALPRNSSPVRLRNRCKLTGRHASATHRWRARQLSRCRLPR